MTSRTLMNLLSAISMTLVVIQIREIIKMRRLSKKLKHAHMMHESLYRVGKKLFEDFVKVHGHAPADDSVICAYCLDPKEMRETEPQFDLYCSQCGTGYNGPERFCDCEGDE